MRTLVVEDDRTSSLLMEGLLSDMGEITVATNGSSALALLAHNNFDLICLDIGLPGDLSGNDVLTYHRALEYKKGIPLGHGAKIIVITTAKDSKTVMDAFRENCDAYMVKPIMAHEFFNTIKELKAL